MVRTAGSPDEPRVVVSSQVTSARRQWTEVPAEDFERVGRRRWRDRASGVEYRQAGGCPLLGVGTDSVRNISCFLVADDKLVFLARADIPEGTYVHHGEVTARQLDVQIAPVRIIH